MIEALWPSLRLFGLALVLGRILLSFLPAGEPGGHALRKLPVTIAASLLLGAGLLLAIRLVSDEFWPLALGLGAGLWLVRWATSPAGIVPRHELERERSGWLTNSLYLGALVPAFLSWPSAGEYPEELSDLCMMELLHRAALLILLLSVAHGLATARRAPVGSAISVLALSLFLFREHANPANMSELVERINAGCVAAGAAFALAWLRRADRRSAVLAIACFVVGRPWDTLDGVILCGVALLALLVCTPRPARPWFAKVAAAGFALCLAPAVYGMRWVGPLPSTGALAPLLRLALVVVTLATVAWIGRTLANRRLAERAEWREELARGDAFLLLLLALVTFVCWLLPAATGALGEAPGMQLVAPLALLLAGCVSIRPERVA